TGTAICLRFCMTITVAVVPDPRTAAVGTWSTLSALATTTATLADIPGLTSEVGLSSVNVTAYVTTLLTTVEVVSTWVTCAATCSLGRAGNETVAGWPTTTRATSVSLSTALSWRSERSTSVMKPWPLELLLLLLEDEEPVPPVPEDAPDVDPVAAADVPPPDTVWSTTPLIPATVPVA